MAGMRILIAEDEPVEALALKEQVAAMGHSVVGEAATGREAVDLAKRLSPDLIIMDIKMPDMDGLEATQIVTRHRPTPVVIVTAYCDQKLVEQANDVGAFAYLTKPFRQEDLGSAISIARTRFEEFSTLRQEVDDLKMALETRKLVERAKGILMERLNIGEADAFKLMQKHSRDQNRKLGQIAEAIVAADEIF